MSALPAILAHLEDAVGWAESEPTDNQTFREAIARWRAAIDEAKKEACPTCGQSLDPN